ncbi:MAG: SMP-30/gluconolactonase/LRE family protein [Chthoniobacteraceae bacterium]
MSLLAAASVLAAEPEFPLTADSKPQDGVPKGELLKFTFEKSKIFPGTSRDYSVYVPKQYDPAKPACLMVFQDGSGKNYEAPTVLDNLIARKELPVIIGVFVMHGKVKALDPERALERFNRSYEYDGLGDNYARFLVDELLPDVEAKTTADGRPIRISKAATDRGICGSSSGGIAAFTAAWETPDAFSRVFTTVGTYVGLRGGDGYPTLIRKFEPKPIRVFLQDGSNDNNIYAGDWWMMNQTMERALTWAGYEVNHAWGEGGHNAKHGTAIFPEVMRWLWKDWPKAPVNRGSQNRMLGEIVDPASEWELVSEGHKGTEGPAANAKGEVFFIEGGDVSKTWKIGLDGKVSVFIDDNQAGGGQSFGADGRLISIAGKPEQIIAYDAAGKGTKIAEGFRGNDLTVRADGTAWVTEPGWDGKSPSQIWLLPKEGPARVVDKGLRFSNGIALSPDQSLLYVADSRTKWVYSYSVQPDGSLKNKQKYFWLHEPDTADDSGADGIEVDRDGRVYVATKMGIQVCDQAGRVNCILPTPNGKVSNLCFGGPKFDTLYATCGDKVFKRKMKVAGAPSWGAPVKPAAPKL